MQKCKRFEFFLNNTNLTFLAFLYKIDIKEIQIQQKIKFPPVGFQLTTPTIYGLEFPCLTHSATESCVILRFSDPYALLNLEMIQCPKSEVEHSTGLCG